MPGLDAFIVEEPGGRGQAVRLRRVKREERALVPPLLRRRER
jgi:hypothetical protein